MKLAPSGIGAEPKKLAFLVGLLVLAGGTYYWMNQPSVPAGASTAAAPVAKIPALPSVPRTTVSSSGPRSTRRGRATSGDDFRPTLKPPEGMDLSSVDPTLKLELMAKVRNVSGEGGTRSLFEFYTPPPPPPPPVAPIKIGAQQSTLVRPPQQTQVPPPAPPPQPIPLKFYGYSGAARSNVRRAFFLDGEDIVQAGENDTIKNRYKIIRIGVNSAVVEDTIAKNQQTLPLAEEAP